MRTLGLALFGAAAGIVTSSLAMLTLGYLYPATQRNTAAVVFLVAGLVGAFAGTLLSDSATVRKHLGQPSA